MIRLFTFCLLLFVVLNCGAQVTLKQLQQANTGQSYFPKSNPLTGFFEPRPLSDLNSDLNLARPFGEVVYGTGTGVTSSSFFKFLPAFSGFRFGNSYTEIGSAFYNNCIYTSNLIIDLDCPVSGYQMTSVRIYGYIYGSNKFLDCVISYYTYNNALHQAEMHNKGSYLLNSCSMLISSTNKISISLPIAVYCPKFLIDVMPAHVVNVVPNQILSVTDNASNVPAGYTLAASLTSTAKLFNGITTSANLTGNGFNSSLDLSNTGVISGNYNFGTVDAKGRLTSAQNVANLTEALNGITKSVGAKDTVLLGGTLDRNTTINTANKSFDIYSPVSLGENHNFFDANGRTFFSAYTDDSTIVEQRGKYYSVVQKINNLGGISGNNLKSSLDFTQVGKVFLRQEVNNLETGVLIGEGGSSLYTKYKNTPYSQLLGTVNSGETSVSMAIGGHYNLLTNTGESYNYNKNIISGTDVNNQPLANKTHVWSIVDYITGEQQPIRKTNQVTNDAALSFPHQIATEDIVVVKYNSPLFPAEYILPPAEDGRVIEFVIDTGNAWSSQWRLTSQNGELFQEIGGNFVSTILWSGTKSFVCKAQKWYIRK